MEQPVLPEVDDLDFSEIDDEINATIAAAEARKAETRGLSAKQRRLAKGQLTEDERFSLLAEIRAYENHHVWNTVAAVALFDTQVCLTCGHTHRFFQGWMTAQQHKTDPNCRRLVRGKPAGTEPERIEEHAHGLVEMCGDCAEACLTINLFIKD